MRADFIDTDGNTQQLIAGGIQPASLKKYIESFSSEEYTKEYDINPDDGRLSYTIKSKKDEEVYESIQFNTDSFIVNYHNSISSSPDNGTDLYAHCGTKKTITLATFTSDDFEFVNGTSEIIQNCTQTTVTLSLQIKSKQAGVNKQKIIALYDSNNNRVSETCRCILPDNYSLAETRTMYFTTEQLMNLKDGETYHFVAEDVAYKAIEFDVSNYDPQSTEYGTCCYSEAKQVEPGNTVILKIHSNSAASYNNLSQFNFFNSDDGTDYHGYGYLDNKITKSSTVTSHVPDLTIMTNPFWSASTEVYVNASGSWYDPFAFQEGEVLTITFIPNITETHNYQFKLYAQS